MIQDVGWNGRTFTWNLPLDAFPAVVERLHGTPARAAELVSGVSEELLSRRWKGKWSAKENLAHLADLQPLDDQRLREYLVGAAALSVADPANHVTEVACHNQVPIGRLVERLRAGRLELACKLEALTEDEVSRTALHPRLQQPMRLWDWAYFVPEHDDHHLARARQAILDADQAVAITATAPVGAGGLVRLTADTIPPTRDLFQIPDGVTYLNCANMAPQLRSITAVGIDAVRTKATPWTLSAPEWFSGAEELRSLAARVMGADVDGVALIPAVSYGIATAAANLPFISGKTIVVLDQEFPSNVYAWRELAKRRNGRVVMIKRKDGENWTDALLRGIDEKTAIVAVPHCHWTDGSNVNLELIGERVRPVGAELVIDATH